MKTEIGFVTMRYNEQGQVEQAAFKPTISITLGKELFNELRTIKSESAEEEVAHNAEVIFAQWFNKTNEIELADRKEFAIVSETTFCSKHPSGKLKAVEIKFSFAKL